MKRFTMSITCCWIIGTAAAAVAAGLVLPATPAEAKPTPSLSAAKQQLARLNDQADQLANQYNKSRENWKAAQSRLKALNSSVTTERRTFDQLHVRVAQLAAAAYKQGADANAAIRKQLRLIDRLGSNIDPGSSKANCSILATGKAETVLKYACAQLGKPYVFGGAGPNSFDCSGLTMMAYKQVGI